MSSLVSVVCGPWAIILIRIKRESARNHSPFITQHLLSFFSLNIFSAVLVAFLFYEESAEVQQFFKLAREEDKKE